MGFASERFSKRKPTQEEDISYQWLASAAMLFLVVIISHERRLTVHSVGSEIALTMPRYDYLDRVFLNEVGCRKPYIKVVDDPTTTITTTSDGQQKVALMMPAMNDIRV